MTTDRTLDVSGPHDGQPLLTAGAPAMAAEAAAVLLHGRGGTAAGTLRLAEEFSQHGVTMLAPQAYHSSWFPYGFTRPIEHNEPELTSAVACAGAAVDAAAEVGVPAERTVVVGISQGGCVGAEFLARNPERFGGAFIISAGLPGEEPEHREFDGALDGTPVFVGSSDDDEYVPVERVHATADAFDRLGADVTERVYEGLGHGLNDDEIAEIRTALVRLVAE